MKKAFRVPYNTRAHPYAPTARYSVGLKNSTRVNHGRSKARSLPRLRVANRSSRSRTATKTKKSNGSKLTIPNGVGGKYVKYTYFHRMAKSMATLVKGARPIMSHDWNASTLAVGFNKKNFADIYVISLTDIRSLFQTMYGSSASGNSGRMMLASLSYDILLTNNGLSVQDIGLYQFKCRRATTYGPTACVMGGLNDVSGVTTTYTQPNTQPRESQTLKELWTQKDYKKCFLSPGESVRMHCSIRLNTVVTGSELFGENASDIFQPKFTFACVLATQGGQLSVTAASNTAGSARNVGFASGEISFVTHRKWNVYSVPGLQVTNYVPPINALPATLGAIPPINIPSGLTAAGGEIGINVDQALAFVEAVLQ